MLTKNYLNAEQREAVNEILSKQLTGQGGFQSLLRRFQGAFHVNGSQDADSNPAVTSQPTTPEVSNVPRLTHRQLAATNGNTNPLRDMIESMIKDRLSEAVDRMVADAIGADHTTERAEQAAGRRQPIDADPDTALETRRRYRAIHNRRSKAMAASWANLSPKQRKARIAAMAAGRSKAARARNRQGR